jgi:hypothetical protein
MNLIPKLIRAETVHKQVYMSLVAKNHVIYRGGLPDDDSGKGRNEK